MVSNQMNKKEEKCSDLYTNIIHKAFQFMLKKNSYNFCTGSEDTLRAWTVSNLCQHKYQCSIPRNLTKKAACSCNVCLVSEDISRAWTVSIARIKWTRHWRRARGQCSAQWLSRQLYLSNWKYSGHTLVFVQIHTKIQHLNDSSILEAHCKPIIDQILVTVPIQWSATGDPLSPFKLVSSSHTCDGVDLVLLSCIYGHTIIFVPKTHKDILTPRIRDSSCCWVTKKPG